jgi:hypothetical protein
LKGDNIMAFAPTPGVGAGGGSASFLSGLGGNISNIFSQMGENPELMAIMLDMIGSKMAPESPFAGVGTMTAKSKLAAEAEKTREGKSEAMFSQLINAITGKEQAGPTDVTISADPAGAGGLAYKITGLEGAEKKLDEITTPVIKSSEDFLKDFGGGGGF